MLLAVTIFYALVRNDDPKRFFTGLGDYISLAPDDSKIIFSYYVDGKESVYTANINGSKVEKITNSNNREDRRPKYSPDGKKIAYLSKNSDGIQTLRVINEDGSEEKQLTDSEMHVTDAIFSHDGKTIYFVAVEAKEFKKGEDSREGFDLFSIETAGEHMRKLTDVDHFTMDFLSLSPDGQTIYYGDFDGERERVYTYSIKNKTVKTDRAILPEKIENDSFEPQLSPDGKYVAYTAISQESKKGLYKYDLYLMELGNENVERLTDLKKAVTSPTFFHKENQIAFLENTNWPNKPAEYRVKTIDIATHDIKEIKLDAPQSTEDHRLMQMVDRAVNSFTIAFLYILLFGFISVYLHYFNPRKIYLPSIVSFSLAILTFIMSFVVGAIFDPWLGMAFGMLAAGILGASIILVLLVLVFRALLNKR